MSQIPIAPAYYTPEQAGILSSLCVQILDQQADQRVQRGRGNYQIVLIAEHDDIEAEFNQLVSNWKTSRRASSFSTAMSAHPAYLRIIGMGEKALPLILRELEKELDHWFVALKAISGADPVPQQSRGNLREMANAWIQWGREQGYAR